MTAISLDLWSPEMINNPHPQYARLRRDATVHRVRPPGGPEDVFLVTGHAQVKAALGDARLSKAPRNFPQWAHAAGIVNENGEAGTGANMLTSDPPDHTRLRSIVSKEFTRRRIDALKPRIQALTDSLLDDMAAAEESGPVDMIEIFAYPLPLTVICELIGVPSSDRGDFRRWITALMTPAISAATRDDAESGGLAIRAYLAEQIAAVRSAGPSGKEQRGLLSQLVPAAGDEGQLTETELIGTMIQLLVAGHETTTNLIANGTLALLTNPDQLAALRKSPELLPSAIEEMLRFTSPVDRSTPRAATEEIVLDGVVIPAGSVVMAVIGSANRDEVQFADGDEFDISRSGNSHLSFGHGIHFCVGAGLARVEGEIAIRSLFDRFPDLTLGCPENELRWRPGLVLRGLTALPVHTGTTTDRS
ncbi:cytochrome P450 family protein [Actinophytocola oryzae]|uniref:Cytochrome P450 n=1 Tax=Actinophytocola oryzae TaxID=502181 RepID=A0A4R7UTH0_9PSEU|nr:cytochrome P450 [Actinophytocola oryzae]TDV37793.1 cytochrome P450 [Actinophytocola oryzae]